MSESAVEKQHIPHDHSKAEKHKSQLARLEKNAVYLTLRCSSKSGQFLCLKASSILGTWVQPAVTHCRPSTFPALASEIQGGFSNINWSFHNPQEQPRCLSTHRSSFTKKECSQKFPLSRWDSELGFRTTPSTEINFSALTASVLRLSGRLSGITGFLAEGSLVVF